MNALTEAIIETEQRVIAGEVKPSELAIPTLISRLLNLWHLEHPHLEAGTLTLSEG